MSQTAKTTAKTLFAGIALFLAAAGLLLHADVPQVPSNTWAPAGDMTSIRAGATGTLLPNGLVLVAGGIDANGPTSSVERFSPDGAHFIDAPSMQMPRANHTATLLADGRVLVAGGTGASGAADATAEIYDSAANAWLPAGSLNVARRGHTATRLADGKVLIAGGDDNGVAIDSLEIFDPATALFTVVDAASTGVRTLHAAAALLDGRVLIAGGFDGTNPLASTSIYDPETNTVSAGPDLSTPRSGLTATTLLDGRVLIAGGAGASGELASAEIFDPATNAFTPTDNTLSSARQNHLAFLLPHNNQVLIVGGLAGGNPVAAAEYFTPWEGTNGVFCAQAICASGYQGPAVPATARSWAVGSALSFPADKTYRAGPNDGLLVLAGGTGQKNSELFGFATVKTDKDDYAPGETVTITGSGWKPHEWVALMLKESPNVDQHSLTDVEADDNGNISTTQFAPDEQDVNIRFYLTAFGQESQAQTTFTDALKINVKRDNPTAANLSVTSGAAFTVQFAVENKNTNPNASTTLAGTYSLTYSPSLVLQSGPSAAGTFTGLTAASAQTLSWSFKAPTGPVSSLNIALSGTITSPTCTDGGATVCTSSASYDVDVTAPADSTPPDTSITAHPTDPANSTSASLSFTGTDDVTPSGSLAFQCSLDGAFFTSCVSPVGYSGLSDGSHTFQVRAIDQANNVDQTPASFTWTIDTTPLTVTINQASGQADPTNTSPINFTVVFNKSVSDFITGDVTLSGTAGATAASVTGSGATYNVAVSGIVNDGTVIASIATGVAHDAASNSNQSSTSSDNTVTYDTHPPTTTPSVGSPNFGSFVGGTTLFTLSCSDTGSGCDKTFYSIVGPADSCPANTSEASYTQYTSPFSLSGPDGEKRLCVFSKDNAGNRENVLQQTYTLDTTAPTETKTIGTPKAVVASTTYVKSTTQISVAASDTGSGLASCTLQIDGGSANGYTQGTNFTLPSPDGSHTLKVICKDNIGNTATLDETDVVDDTGPTLSKNVGSPKFVSGTDTYVKSTTPIQVTANDGSGSGVDAGACTIAGAVANSSYSSGADFYLPTPDGAKTFTVKCQDRLGNESTALTETDIVDDTAPGNYSKTIGTPKFFDGTNMFVKSSTPISVTADDGAGSGISGCTLSFDALGSAAYVLGNNFNMPAGDGSHTLHINCVDHLNNSSTFNETDIVDDTGPTVTITTPPNGQSYLLNQVVHADYACNDNGGSGVNTCTGPVANGTAIDTNPVGTKSFSVTGTDHLGNSTTVTNSYSVEYKTCLLYDPTRTVKNGATYPIKLYLCDFNSNDVSGPGTTIHAASIFLGSTFTGAPEDAGNANPDSDFRFDITLGPSGGYIFNLQTKGLASGQYGMTFTVVGDPSTYTVFPAFGVK